MGERPPPTRPPIGFIGAARDAELGFCKALSREEVLRRRRRRLVQLYSLYRAQYWALADEVPAKHGEYWWEHGTSPVLPEKGPPGLPLPPHLPGLSDGAGVAAPVKGGGVGYVQNGGVCAPALAAGCARVVCKVSNCEIKAMALSPYCFDHILLDTKQQLYHPCSFPTKQSGALNGDAICGKPALRGISPLRCADHNPKSKKLILEALKSVGIDLPLACKSVPKLSLLISETVCEIQMKRKLSLNYVKTIPDRH